MIVTINPHTMVVVFFKVLLGIIITGFASSLVLFPLLNTNENKEQGTRRVVILEKINNEYVREFKVEDIITGNKFTITPTETWYKSMEVGSITSTSASLNDTRDDFMMWLVVSFIIDLMVLGLSLIGLLTMLPEWIGELKGKEFILDLRSKKTKQKELTLLELEKHQNLRLGEKIMKKLFKA